MAPEEGEVLKLDPLAQILFCSSKFFAGWVNPVAVDQVNTKPCMCCIELCSYSYSPSINALVPIQYIV